MRKNKVFVESVMAERPLGILGKSKQRNAKSAPQAALARHQWLAGWLAGWMAGWLDGRLVESFFSTCMLAESKFALWLRMSAFCKDYRNCVRAVKEVD